MRFCEKCGSYMRETSIGLKCSRCGDVINTPIVEVKYMKRGQQTAIDVVLNSDENYRRVNKTCPQCGNPEAFTKMSFSSGEHSGIRQERAVERLTCTRCNHSWTEN